MKILLEEAAITGLFNRKINKNIIIGDRVVGEGAWGVVVEATYKTDVVKEAKGKEVVVKILHPNLWFHESSRERFSKEVENDWNIMFSVNSKNVVKPLFVFSFDAMFKDGTKIKIPAIVLPKYKSNLSQELLRLNLEGRIRAISDVLNGLSDVFKATKLTHNDIHLGNILYDGENFAISDFGLARLVSQIEEEIKSSPEFGGSPYFTKSGYYQSGNFFPPRDLKLTPEKIDVYMMGALLIYLMSGIRAKENPDYEVLIKKTVKNLPGKLKNLEKILKNSFTPMKSRMYNNILEMRKEWFELLPPRQEIIRLEETYERLKKRGGEQGTLTNKMKKFWKNTILLLLVGSLTVGSGIYLFKSCYKKEGSEQIRDERFVNVPNEENKDVDNRSNGDYNKKLNQDKSSEKSEFEKLIAEYNYWVAIYDKEPEVTSRYWLKIEDFSRLFDDAGLREYMHCFFSGQQITLMRHFINSRKEDGEIYKTTLDMFPNETVIFIDTNYNKHQMYLRIEVEGKTLYTRFWLLKKHMKMFEDLLKKMALFNNSE